MEALIDLNAIGQHELVVTSHSGLSRRAIWTNIAIAFTTTATHTTVSSPPSAPTLQPKAPRLCKGFIL
ncbi:hypothetical protein V8C40DRAFT_245416 [Trichoderma camerunense]